MKKEAYLETINQLAESGRKFVVCLNDQNVNESGYVIGIMKRTAYPDAQRVSPPNSLYEDHSIICVLNAFAVDCGSRLRYSVLMKVGVRWWLNSSCRLACHSKARSRNETHEMLMDQVAT